MSECNEKEYELLRAEMIEWQNRRFTIVGVCIGVITSLLGFSEISGVDVTWDFISCLSLFFISVSCWLTAYCGIANTKASTYLQVFHEMDSGFKWETRLADFSKLGKKYGNLNQHIASIYLVLAFISLVSPPLMFKSNKAPEFAFFIVFLLFITFVISFIWLYKSQGHRDMFIETWRTMPTKVSERSLDEMKWNPGNKDYQSRIALRCIQATVTERQVFGRGIIGNFPTT